MLRLIEKWIERCELALLYVAVLAALAMTCLTTADAASRYLLNMPILGAYEITEKYLMVGTVFLGVSYAYRGGAFIRITFFVDRLPAAGKLVLNYIAQFVSLAYCVLLVVATIQQSLRVHGNGTTLSAPEWPLAPAYFLVPIGLFFLSVLVLTDVLRVKSGKSHLFLEASPDS